MSVELKKNRLHILFILFISMLSILEGQAQLRKPINQPFADQKLYHLGFVIGLNAPDMIISHSGFAGSNGEVWFAEIPSYSTGFTVGIVGDRYLNEHFNLRISPTLNLGEKRFIFKEQTSGEEYTTRLRNNYVTIPLHLKFSASRIKNYRPYLLAGGYTSIDVAGQKDAALRFKSVDYGLEFGLGCNIYFPLFKLCPELRFSFGLVDLINKDRSDLTDKDLQKYTDAISSGKSRMVTLVFNFE